MPKGKSRALNHPLAPGFPELKKRLEGLPGLKAEVTVLRTVRSGGGVRRLKSERRDNDVICSYVLGGSIVTFKVVCNKPEELMKVLNQVDQQLRTGRKVA